MGRGGSQQVGGNLELNDAAIAVLGRSVDRYSWGRALAHFIISVRQTHFQGW